MYVDKIAFVKLNSVATTFASAAAGEDQSESRLPIPFSSSCRGRTSSRVATALPAGRHTATWSWAQPCQRRPARTAGRCQRGYAAKAPPGLQARGVCVALGRCCRRASFATRWRLVNRSAPPRGTPSLRCAATLSHPRRGARAPRRCVAWPPLPPWGLPPRAPGRPRHRAAEHPRRAHAPAAAAAVLSHGRRWWPDRRRGCG